MAAAAAERRERHPLRCRGRTCILRRGTVGSPSWPGGRRQSATANNRILLDCMMAVEPASFRRVCSLGQGAFSSVSLGILSDGSFVALKTYSRSGGAEARAGRILQEKAVLQALDSPYIMRLRGTNRVGDALLFFLEPAMGGPLHQHLRRLPGAHLDEDTVMLYTAELLSALAHMHSRSCIHRDLKASNCLLDEAGHIKLCDFSAAKQMGPSPAKTSAAATVSCARTFTVIGTAEFMSPEMLLRSVGYTFATDVWSLGVLMYEMLVGRRPFTDPARHWLVAGDERGSDRDPASEGEVSPGDNDRRVIEFFEQHCQSHLNCPARGGDELDEFDLGADPISAAAWSLLSERLLAPTEAGRLPTTDNLEQAREHPFLRDIDWVALEAHALPPVDIDRTVGQLHLLGSPVGEGTDEDALSEEQQRMFDGF